MRQIQKRTGILLIVGFMLLLLAAALITLYMVAQPDPVPEPASSLAASSSEPPVSSSYVRPSIAVDAASLPAVGDKYGRISIPGTQVDADLYFGDRESEFRKGAGTYAGGKLPGFDGTVLIAAHCTTHFLDLGSAAVGSQVLIETGYGSFRYEITQTRIADEKDTDTYDLEADHENLILYTCYPFGVYYATPQRYFVYGKLIEGPLVSVGENEEG